VNVTDLRDAQRNLGDGEHALESQTTISWR
jgi:hypothetical protein